MGAWWLVEGRGVIVRLTQIDGVLPNLALMKLAHFHRAQGDDVRVTRQIEPDLFEPRYDRVYGSAIFDFSRDRLDRFTRAWPEAITGGTGSGSPANVESITGEEHRGVDYDGFPDFKASIGFTQRGCRLKCKFCVVPTKEGKNRPAGSIASIWRGPGFEKQLHLLDNDFFGNPEWRERIAEIRDGGFEVCLSQGINVRLINDEAAAALATIKYKNTDFVRKQLYTAWDNLGDEKVFFRGVDVLEANGIEPKHLMAYMLIGYDPLETWGRIWHRFTRMVERGISPYPMVYAPLGRDPRADLKCFQRWVIAAGGMYRWISWGNYERETKSAASVEAWKPYADRLRAALPKLQKAA
jgi:hypothetical protein